MLNDEKVTVIPVTLSTLNITFTFSPFLIGRKTETERETEWEREREREREIPSLSKWPT